MRVIWYTAMSMDGRIAGPEHDLGFLSLIEGGPDEAGDFDAFMAGIDAVLVGANTIRWLIREGHGLPSSGVPMWLLTHDEGLVAQAKERADDSSAVRKAEGDIEQILDTIAREGAQNVWLCGGGDVAGQVLAADRLDEVIATIAPTALGAGPALFDAGDLPLRRFTLAECRPYGNAARLRWVRETSTS